MVPTSTASRRSQNEIAGSNIQAKWPSNDPYRAPTSHRYPPKRLNAKFAWFVANKVMLDSDLAELYGVPTKRLNEQVKRNIKRFPSDFMFQLSTEEARDLRSQIATSKDSRGGRRYIPYVFTEQGVAMLSSVLNSERSIQVNIAIIRAFVRLREVLATHKELASKLKAI